MEIVKIGGREWQKSKGSEGQDVYVARFMIGENELLGKMVDKEAYDILIDEDADFYLPPNCDMTDQVDCNQKCADCMSEDEVAFKFRKNVFTPEEQLGAFEGLYGAAVESNNRGMAAGPREESQGNRDWVTGFQSDILKFYIAGQPHAVDGSDQIQSIIDKHAIAKDEKRGEVWLRTKVEAEFGSYKNFFPLLMEKVAGMSVDEAIDYCKMVKDKFISGTSYATAIWSGIAGYYGRYPRIPYGRATAFTDHNKEEFEKCYPFARKLDREMAKLMPVRYARQKKHTDRLDNKFLIGEDTAFTTITVNTTQSDRNARMACHRDAGSLNEGFSNLTVITKDGKSWNGGYLVAPEVRAAINVRPGDLLLIDNMRVIHGNTPIEAPDTGVQDMLRMSLVFYYREDMDALGSWDYEALRKQFVDDRRLNKQHPLWRPFWNGVSPGFLTDESEEWYNYLMEKGGEQMMKENQMGLWENFNIEKASLEGFFA